MNALSLVSTIRTDELQAICDAINKSLEGEFNNVAMALNAILTHLKTMVGDTTTSSDKFATSAKEILSGSTDTSIRTEEQASGIEQVTKGVQQMDEMTQQNSASVELTSAASVSMSEEADNLNKLVRFFS